MGKSTLQDGQSALLKICEALGMDHLPIRNMQIDMDCDGMVNIHTQMYIEEKAFEQVVDAVKDAMPKQEKTPPKSKGIPKLKIPASYARDDAWGTGLGEWGHSMVHVPLIGPNASSKEEIESSRSETKKDA